jgi:hypothetical protein
MATHTIPPHVGDDSGFERLYRVHVDDIHR